MHMTLPMMSETLGLASPSNIANTVINVTATVKHTVNQNVDMMSTSNV